MTAAQLQTLGIILVVLGVAALVISQFLLSIWHKKTIRDA